MNIAQLSEQLKDVPQNRLIDYARNPNSVVPQFLALAEIQRRQHLQAQAAPAPATVAEDVLGQTNPQVTPEMMAQQLPENQPGVAQLPTGMPRGMAGGGIVAFAGGGEADSYDNDDDEEDLQDRRHNANMMSLIAGLRARAKDAVGAVPRAVEAVKAAIPKSYEAVKQAATSKAAIQEGDVEGFLSKLQHLESRGRHFDAKGNILTSPKGAEGIMQVMRHTQRDPGYGVTPARDRSPEELERVGRDYGIAMLKEFGDPQVAAMAYNWGPGNVKKWLASGKTLPVPKETLQYRSHFSKGGIASFAGKTGSLVGEDEEDSDYDNEYLNRSRSLVSGVRSIYDALTTPKNYDFYDMYKRNIGEPFARGVSNFVNEPLESQAERFRSYSQNPTKEGPAVGYREPLGVKVEAPASPRVVAPSPYGPSENDRLHARYPAPIVRSVQEPEDQTWRDFDSASALFQAEQRAKDIEQAAGKSTPKEVDPYTAALLRAAQEREDIKASAQTDKYLAMLQASLGMMAGSSPYALQNIGQGGMQGVAAYAAAKKQRAAELSDLNKYEARIMNAKETAEIKQAQLRSLDEDRKDKIQLYRDRLSEQEKRDFDSKLTRVGALVTQHPQIKALEKRRMLENPIPGSPQDLYYDDAIEAVRKAVYEQNGLPYEFAPVKLPAYPSPKAESKGSWLSNLFGGSSTPASSGLTKEQQDLLNKYPTK